MPENLPGKRVLIVEDNPLLAFDVKDLLDELGAITIGPALDLASGLHLLNDNQPDAALLDVDLGGEFVWPLADRLKERQIPFAFISADCTEDFLPDPFRRMVCLEKPASKEEITRLVAELARGANRVGNS